MARAALSATRAIAVLNFLAAHPVDSFTLSEIANRLHINLASAHSLLAVLTDEGYVVRHPRQRTYTLGPSVVALGSAALERHAAIDLARDAARQLAREVELEVAVSAPAGNDIVVLSRSGPHRARGSSVHVGQRIPLAPPLGAVFVAWGEAEGWLQRALDPERQRVALAGVRARGYSVALEGDTRQGLGAALEDVADLPADDVRRDEIARLVTDLGRREYQLNDFDPDRTYDVSMIAAPVFDNTGHAALALTLVGFAPGLSAADVARFGERVRDAGLIVTKASSGRVPVPAV